MGLTVRVIRDLGDVPAPETIVSQYFRDEAVFRQIGRVEIDASARGLKLASMTFPGMRQSRRPGEVIHLSDPAAEYRARVGSILFSVGRQADGRPYATCSMGVRMMRVG